MTIPQFCHPERSEGSSAHARKIKKYTSLKMNVKREFVVRIESGQQNMTVETLYRLGEAMGKEIRFIFE